LSDISFEILEKRYL